MRIDMGLVLGIVLECIIFIYYADALFTRKRNKLFCRLVAVSGYAMHFIGCMFGNVTANVIIFIIIKTIMTQVTATCAEFSSFDYYLNSIDFPIAAYFTLYTKAFPTTFTIISTI